MEHFSRVDVVIPARDEGARVVAVALAAVGARPFVDRVIVVANGCRDDTAEQARGVSGTEVLELSEGDKGSAMREGLRWVTAERVLFCDADLEGLTPDHLAALTRVVPLDGMVVGLVDRATTGFTRLLPPITGQRILPVAFARSLELEAAGYEAELRIDAAVGAVGMRHRDYVLRGVTNYSRAVVDPLRFAKMVGSVALAGAAFAPELVAYERGRV